MIKELGALDPPPSSSVYSLLNSHLKLMNIFSVVSLLTKYIFPMHFFTFVYFLFLMQFEFKIDEHPPWNLFHPQYIFLIQFLFKTEILLQCIFLTQFLKKIRTEFLSPPPPPPPMYSTLMQN
jgi:hypothetical protein